MRLGKRGWLIIGGGLPVVGLLAILVWASVQSGGNPGGLAVNSDLVEARVDQEMAPDFELQLFGGGSVRLSELRGKAVMVDFWASWCAPCRQEAPVLAQVYREYRDRQVEFVGVGIWDREGDAIRYVAEEGLDYFNGSDAAGVIAIDYGVRGIPEKFFVNPEGVIVKKFVGPLDTPSLRAILDELLAGG